MAGLSPARQSASRRAALEQSTFGRSEQRQVSGPSSGASRHLLPRGKKEEREARCRLLPFSPRGRRWLGAAETDEGRAPPVSLMGFNPLLGRVSKPGNRFALFPETLYNPPMPRYRLILEYDGTPFAGWQRQADLMSVQQALEEAIARFSGETVVTHAAGRTDAGVHALGQVVHFDLARDWDANRIREALNYHLKPQPVAVVESTRVPDNFEARFGALARHYEYRFVDH